MTRGKSTSDETTLRMALVGYQVERQKIEERIREIEAELGGRRTSSTASARGVRPARKKRVLSPAARRRIAEAQKKRWAEHRKRAAAASK